MKKQKSDYCLIDYYHGSEGKTSMENRAAAIFGEYKGKLIERSHLGALEKELKQRIDDLQKANPRWKKFEFRNDAGYGAVARFCVGHVVMTFQQIREVIYPE